MTEQQKYRVIADRDKGDDPTVDQITVGDRYTMQAEAGAVFTDQVIRIERPVPTTDEPEDKTQDLRTQVANLVPLSMVDGRDHRGNVFEVADEIIPVVLASVTPSLPTREQIIDAITCGNLNSVCDFEEEIADRVLALLQKRADRG